MHTQKAYTDPDWYHSLLNYHSSAHHKTHPYQTVTCAVHVTLLSRWQKVDGLFKELAIRTELQPLLDVGGSIPCQLGLLHCWPCDHVCHSEAGTHQPLPFAQASVQSPQCCGALFVVSTDKLLLCKIQELIDLSGCDNVAAVVGWQKQARQVAGNVGLSLNVCLACWAHHHPRAVGYWTEMGIQLVNRSRLNLSRGGNWINLNNRQNHHQQKALDRSRYNIHMTNILDMPTFNMWLNIWKWNILSTVHRQHVTERHCHSTKLKDMVGTYLPN